MTLNVRGIRFFIDPDLGNTFLMRAVVRNEEQKRIANEYGEYLGMQIIEDGGRDGIFKGVITLDTFKHQLQWRTEQFNRRAAI